MNIIVTIKAMLEEIFPHAIQEMIDTNDFDGLHKTKFRIHEILEEATRNRGFLRGGEKALESVQTELDHVHQALMLVSRRRILQVENA